MSEYILARRCILFSGTTCLTLEDLMTFLHLMGGKEIDILMDIGGAWRHAQGLFFMWRQAQYNRRFDPHCRCSLPLSYLLRQGLAVRMSTEPVDRTYAVLGIMHPIYQERVAVDYSPDKTERYWEVYIEACQLALTPHTSAIMQRSAADQIHSSTNDHSMRDISPDWQIICDLLESASNNEAETRPFHLPSWCPNFQEADPIMRLSAYGIPTIFGDLPLHYASSINKRSITLFGLRVASVQNASIWQDVFYERLQLFIDQCYAIADHYLGNNRLRLNSLPRRTARTARRTIHQRVRRVLINNTILSPYRWQPLQWVIDGWFRDCLKSDEHYHLLDVVCGRRFVTAITTNNHPAEEKLVFGMAPGQAKPGDLVVVFPHLDTPMVVEDVTATAENFYKGLPFPVKHGYYRIKGQAYLEGITTSDEVYELYRQRKTGLGGECPGELFTLV